MSVTTSPIPRARLAGEELSSSGERYFLPAGEYATTSFEPALSFRIDEGWEALGGELPDIFYIGRREAPLALSFSNPREVYDPKSPAKMEAVPEPEDWVAWFRDHPYLDSGKAVSVTVGGVSAARFDVEVSSAPRDYPNFCPTACVPLRPMSDDGSFAATLGPKSQYTVVEVGGETVLFGFDAGTPSAAKELEKFLPEAQKVIDTVEWKAES